jgi:hypothetical protein
MEVQSIHSKSVGNDISTDLTVSCHAPVVVTPTKDSTSIPDENGGTTPDEDVRSNVLDAASAIPVDVKVDGVPATTSVVEELEIDPTTGTTTGTSSVAKPTSTSPEITIKTPSTEKAVPVVTSTKKRPATLSSKERTGTSDSNNSSSSPSSTPGNAKRSFEKPATTTNIGTTSPSAVAKNWKQASMVHAELAALKQRGLAKLLNQHFTSTAQQLAIEKAAADAAILDLQERKARTREFTPTNSSEISPLDQACIQANKWRAECRRKERETLLLYQQYVHKFGPTTILPVPTVPTTAHDGAKVGNSSTKSAVIPTAPTLPPQSSISRPVPTLVPTMTAQIEQTLEEYCARGAVAHPSILTHGREQTYSSVAAKEEHTFREYYRKQLEAKGVDAICSPGYFKGNGTATSDMFTPNTVGNEDNEPHEEWNKDDVCSIVSGLTTLHSAMTREFIYDCENSVQTFLRDEQATVRKLLEEEDQDYDASSSGDTHVSNILVVQDSDATAKAAENMVQQMQEILQEYQMKHFGSGNGTTTATEPNDNPVPEKEYPIAYTTDNSNEKWVIYYDEFYRQEYYHEVHTNRTQWDPPKKKTSDNNDPPESSFSHSHSSDTYSVMNGTPLEGGLYDDLGLYHPDDDRMDRIIESNNHRVAVYRKRQRRKRLRRRLIATMVVIISILVGSGGAYYHTCYQNENNKSETCSLIENIVLEHWNQFNGIIVSHKEEVTIPDIPPQPEQCVLQLTDEIDMLVRRPHNMTVPNNEPREEIIRRPWGCNIPLAYLFHSKCRRMATLLPIFDLQALINCMIQ